MNKCPTCGTVFIEDMDPIAVERREKQRKKRSRAAKRAWKIRITQEAYAAAKKVWRR